MADKADEGEEDQPLEEADAAVPADPRDKEETKRIRKLLDSGEAVPMDDIARTARSIANENARQNIELKKMYAKWMLRGMGLQLILANLIFIGYAFGKGWKIDPDVMKAWLAATVVQLVGVVYVITRYLFPRRDKD